VLRVDCVIFIFLISIFTSDSCCRRFQFIVFVFKISTMVVLLSLSTTITALIATTLLGLKSKIYSNGMSEKLQERNIRQKQAVDMFMACSIIGQAQTDGVVRDTVTNEVFQKCGLKDKEAKSLSKLIMGDDGEMTVMEFCDFAGLDFMKVEELLLFEKRKFKKEQKKSSNKVNPSADEPSMQESSTGMPNDSLPKE